MPIITCGGMRQQFTWKQQASTSNPDITKECDANFQAIVDRYVTKGVRAQCTAPRGTYQTSMIEYDGTSYIGMPPQLEFVRGEAKYRAADA